MKICVDGYCLV